MKVYNDIRNLPRFNNAVITIGTFDGVHSGHRQILRQLLEEAEKIGGDAVVITFYPHPKHIIESKEKPVFLLNTPSEKYTLLHRAGINHVVEVPFTREFSEQTAGKFIEDFLVNYFKPHTIIIGYDHRFGKDRKGDYEMLKMQESRYGYKVIEIPRHVLQQSAISSTRIREALQEGNIEMANQYLGYPYSFSGTVVRGNQLGRSIGFPTANLSINHERKLIPASGVYAVWVDVPGHGVRQGMMNIGTRPTVDGKSTATEVHLLDFDFQIYGSTLQVSLIGRIRNEEKFSGMDALKHQLLQDRERTREILSLSHHDLRNHFLE
jgi:riboflavin kinase/FMN adenylyltransferase